MLGRIIDIFTVSSAIILLAMSFQKLSVSENTGPQVLAAATTERFVFDVGKIDLNQLLADVNSKRSIFGNNSLKASRKLSDIASLRARDLVNREYYSHISPDGLYYYDLLREAGVRTGYSCENLDIVFGADGTRVLADWLTSNSGHKECVLDPRINSAGYAVESMGKVSHGSETIESFMVVAIHAQMQ